jgi:hypothetical protein
MKPNTKKVQGVVQAIEHLLSKYEALSSNPSTTKKKKKTKQLRLREVKKCPQGHTSNKLGMVKW